MALSRVVIAALLFAVITVSQAMSAPFPKTQVSLRDVIASVEEQFKEDANGFPLLQDVTADFMQSSTLAANDREMRAQGQMFVKFATSTEPLMFRFDYFGPMNQQIVSNGRTMWVYLPANRQVIQSDVSFVFNPFSSDRRQGATNFLQGLGRISRDFMIDFSSEGKDVEGNYILELQPKRTMSTIQRLYMVVNAESVLNRVNPSTYPFRHQSLAFPIRSTTVIDHDGNSTRIEFSNIRANTRIPRSYFTFDIPADAQVVPPPAGR